MNFLWQQEETMMRNIALTALVLLTLTACSSDTTPPAQHDASLSKALSQQPVAQPAAEVEEVVAIEPAAPQIAVEAEECEEAPAPAQLATQDTAQPTTAILTLQLENDFGPVHLNHRGHVDMMSCDTCHTTNPPAKITKSKKEFHALCRKCHVDNDAGPTKCRGCHIRQ